MKQAKDFTPRPVLNGDQKMSEIIVPFYQGWIRLKDELKHNDEFSKIINFYVFGTPCELTSSSGQSIRDRKWEKDLWKSPELRSYLLSKAGLKNGTTYAKATKLDTMSSCATTIGLSGNFQSVRDKNRIVFYSDKKTVDILTIFYFIRCSFAHGRFEIYENNDHEYIYVLEAIKKKSGSSDCVVKARMVLKESTLLLWSNTIIGGKAAFVAEKNAMELQIQNDVLQKIANNPSTTKHQIVESLNHDDAIVYKQLNVLINHRKIQYDKSKKIWRCT